MTSEVVLVTGAGSGMGQETALLLASAGYRVYGSVLNSREAGALSAAARQRNVPLEVMECDVTREEAPRAAVGAVLAAQGRVDALVQFVGIGLRGFFEDLDMAEIERVFQVNVFGLMRMTQAVLPHMRQARRGRIVLTSSIGGRMGSMSISGYAASKFALEGWAECLRQEVAPFGIRVSLLEPGLLRTPHFGIHRNRARRAVDAASPYYPWFCQHEKIVDNLLSRSTFTATDVARKVQRILREPRPALRYVVGRRARLILALRRHTPGEWFESVYWRILRRMVTKPRVPARGLSGGEAETEI
ncbi:MAG: SDR family oxidoreductase [Acidobacteriota bacterium]